MNAISGENSLKLRGEIIFYYHQEFEKALKSFGFLKYIPTLLDVQKELLKYGCLEVEMTICFMLFFYMDLTSIDLSELLATGDTKEMKKQLYANQEYKDFLQSRLPEFLHKGFI